MLIDGLKIEIVGLDGSSLRRLGLHPTKDYQRIPEDKAQRWFCAPGPALLTPSARPASIRAPALPEVEGRLGHPELFAERVHPLAGHGSGTDGPTEFPRTCLGMDNLPVAHDQTLTTLARPMGNRPIGSPTRL